MAALYVIIAILVLSNTVQALLDWTLNVEIHTFGKGLRKMFSFTKTHHFSLLEHTVPFTTTAAATRRKEPWHKESYIHTPVLNQHVYESKCARSNDLHLKDRIVFDTLYL